MRNLIIIFFLLFPSIVLSQSADKNSNAKYWIIFKDKGSYKPNIVISPGSDAEKECSKIITDRAVKRRKKVLPTGRVLIIWIYRFLKVI